MREVIEAVGASPLYLTSLGPDLNPIEQVFAKVKALLRKAAARMLGALIAVIADTPTAFSSDE